MPQGRIPSHLPGFVAPDQALDCGKCIAHHATKYDFPPLDAQHVEAWNLWLLLQDQQRVGMEAIGLDVVALPAAFEMLAIPRARWKPLFLDIMVLNHAMQAHRAAEREQDQLAKRAGR